MLHVRLILLITLAIRITKYNANTCKCKISFQFSVGFFYYNENTVLPHELMTLC